MESQSLRESGLWFHDGADYCYVSDWYVAIPS